MFCCSRSLALLTVGGLFAAVLAAAAAPASQTSSTSPKPAASPAAPADEFEIDPVHSSVIYKVRHMGVSNFYGTFKEIGGQISMDAKDPTKSSVTFTIQAASIDSRNPKRDQDLSGPDFFSVKEFPTIEFKSTSVKPAGKDGYDVTGKFTMHGVTKDLTLKVQQVGTAEGQHGKIAGYETHTTLKRSDYGMDAGVANGMIGDEVEVTVSVEVHAE